jgi:excisionase family DNA binding protein
MPTKPETEPLADSIADTAIRLGVGRSNVYELLNSGQLESFKLGRRRLIPRSAQQKLIANLTVETTRLQAKSSGTAG